MNSTSSHIALALGALLLFGGAVPAEETFRLSWETGDMFVYHWEAEVTVGKRTSLLQGEVTVRALSPTAALLERRVTSLVEKDEETPSRTATAGELGAMRIVLPLSPNGDVPRGARLSEEQEIAARAFLTSLFPIPPEGRRDGWKVRIVEQGEALEGTGRVVGTVDLDGVRCTKIRFDASSATGREIGTTAYFSSDLGAFVRVDRKIRTPGPPQRTEVLHLRLRRHPAGPVLDPEYRRDLNVAEEATRRDPTNPSAWGRLAKVLEAGGSQERALDAIRRATKLEPDDAAHRTSEGKILADLGRHEEATTVLAGIVSEHPHLIHPRLLLARTLFQGDRIREAAVHAEGALRQSPDSTDARFLLGIIRGKQGRREEAAGLIRSCYPAAEGARPPAVTFDSEGNLRLVLPDPQPAERAPLTPEERAAATRILEEIVREEAGRHDLSTEEVDRLLAYVASVCGTDPPGMIADFMADREGTARRISRSLQERSVIQLDDVRALLSSDDDDLRLGAVFYLPFDEAVEILKKRIEKESPRPDAYLHFASVVFRKEGAAVHLREDLVDALRKGSIAEPDNGIYGYLLASIFLDEGKTIPAVEEIAEALGRPEIATHRAREARLRRKALTAIGFDPVFRASAAWADSESPFPRHVSRAAEGMIAFAGKVEEDGDVADAREYLEWVLLIASQARSSSEVGLLRESWAFEGAALQALVEMDRRIGDKDAARRHEEWRQAAEKQGPLRSRALVLFQAKRTKALHLWPITSPARTRDYLRRALSNERRLFERALEEARPSSRGPR